MTTRFAVSPLVALRRIENILLSRTPVWIVVVLLTLGAAGTVVFGALVEDTATGTQHFPYLGNVAIGIARIPKNLLRLSGGPHPAEAQEQRFDGQAGLAFANTAPFRETEGGKGICSLRDIFRSRRSMNRRGGKSSTSSLT